MTNVDSSTLLHPENTYLFFAVTHHSPSSLIKIRINASSETQAKSCFPDYHLIFAGKLPCVKHPVPTEAGL